MNIKANGVSKIEKSHLKNTYSSVWSTSNFWFRFWTISKLLLWKY